MTTAKQNGRQEIRAPGVSAPLSHYTDVVRCGDFIFISGCTALNERGEVVSVGDVIGQTRQTLENMRACLSAANLTFENVAKVTVYLIDVDDREAINPVREEFFGATKPSSTLVGVKSLVIPELLVEIDAVAYDG